MIKIRGTTNYINYWSRKIGIKLIELTKLNLYSNVITEFR